MKVERELEMIGKKGLEMKVDRGRGGCLASIQASIFSTESLVTSGLETYGVQRGLEMNVRGPVQGGL